MTGTARSRSSALPGGVRFRAAGPDDAAAVLALKHGLGRETSFMMFEPGERAETAEDVAAELQHGADAANSMGIVPEGPAGRVGYVDARGGRVRRGRRGTHRVA